MAELLLHSMREFDEVIFQIAERIELRGVLEIGGETGAFTERLLAFCASRSVKMLTIDPKPREELMELARASTTLDLLIGYSIPHLEEHGTDANLILLDGDHNYYTVSSELALLDRAWKARDIAGVMLLHDVGFPHGRRDSYYDPTTIPEAQRRAFSFKHGVNFSSNKPVLGRGFRGEGVFAWAMHEDSEHSGVLTAVEDFVKSRPEYTFRKIDAVFGLGALTLTGSPADKVVGEVFAPYDNELIRRLERNRLELYFKVLELQDTWRAP